MFLRLRDWFRGNEAPRSPQWQALAAAAIKEFGKCAACGATSDLEAHHKKPYHLWPELELVRSNIMVLHRPCHLLIGHLGDWKAFNPQVEIDCERLYKEVSIRPYAKIEFPALR